MAVSRSLNIGVSMPFMGASYPLLPRSGASYSKKILRRDALNAARYDRDQPESTGISRSRPTRPSLDHPRWRIMCRANASHNRQTQARYASLYLSSTWDATDSPTLLDLARTYSRGIIDGEKREVALLKREQDQWRDELLPES